MTTTPPSTGTKILTWITSVGTAFNTLVPAVKLVVIVAVLALLYFGVASAHKPSNVEVFDAKYGVYTKSVDSTVKWVKDSMATLVTKHQQVAQSALAKVDQQQTIIVKLQKSTPSKDSLDALKRQVDSLKKATNDSVVLARTVIPKQDTIIAKQDTAIAKKDSTIAAYVVDSMLFRKALFQKDSTIAIQGTSITKLTKIITTMPKAPTPDKFLGFIPMPDRKTAAAWGFLGGTLLTLEAIHLTK
jgi:hypothetical protein